MAPGIIIQNGITITNGVTIRTGTGSPPVETYYLLTEDGDILTTELDEPLILEEGI